MAVGFFYNSLFIITMIRKRTFKLPVSLSGELLTKEFDLLSDMGSVIGLAVTSDRRDLVFYRGSIGVSIAGKDLIQEGEDANEYMFGIEHPSRTWAFGELPLDSTDRRMRVRYQDSEVAGRAFSVHVVKIVVTYQVR